MHFRNVVHTSSRPDDTEAFLAAKRIGLQVGRQDGAGFATRISAQYARNFYVACMDYGAPVSIAAGAERGDFGFSAPLAGRAVSVSEGEAVGCSPSRAVIASPGRDQRLELDAGVSRLSFSAGAEAMRRRLAALTGAPVRGDIVFAPEIALDTGPGRLIIDGIHLIARHGQADPAADDIRLAAFEDMALSALLLYHPHSHSDLLGRPSGGPASRDVRRVLDYIEANLEAPLRLEDLVAVAGVPGRTLNAHFRAFTGLSPIAYLREARMRAARAVLLAGAGASVTEVAMRFGFLHVGRFSTAYARAFGELPSATLAAARHRHGI